MMIWLYIVLGASAGLLAGLLGVGGGLLVVPALVWVFQAKGFPEAVVMHFAVGTSLALMVLTTSVSTWRHRRQGVAIRRLYRALLPALVLGLCVGLAVGHGLHSHVLRALFGLFVCQVVLRMMYRLCRSKRQSHDAVDHASEKPLSAYGRLWPLAAISGVMSGLFGVGSGTLGPMLLNRGLPVREVVGSCAACSVTVAVLGALSQMGWGMQQAYHPAHSVGYVYFPVVLSMGLVTPVGAWVGAWLSHRIATVHIQWLFMVILCVISVKMLWPMMLEVVQYVV